MRKPSTSTPNSPLITQDNLPLGAHLTTPRRGYLHHGIYAGNGRVIHYGGVITQFGRGRVEDVPLERFARGRAVHVNTPVAPKYSNAVRVERARSRLGERRYRLWSNNCEHFCEWCISGTSRSRQIEAWIRRLADALAALTLPRAASRMRDVLQTIFHPKSASTDSQSTSNQCPA
jgi:hypothetical protein